MPEFFPPAARRTLLAAPLLVFVPLPSSASPDAADPILCDGRFRTQVIVDGLQRDWEDEAAPSERYQTLIAGEAAYDWLGPADASFRLWCRFAEHGIWFAIVGRDDHLLAPEGRSPGDRLEILFDLAAGRPPARPVRFTIPLWPALEDGRVTPTRTLQGETHEPAGAVAEIAPRDGGFFAEIYLPFTALPGLGRPLGPIPFAVLQRDIDRDTPREQEVTVATGPVDPDDPTTWNSLTFTSAEDRLQRMRASIPGGASVDPVGPAWGFVAGANGPVFAALLADHLLLTGEGFDGFTWVGLPARSLDDTVLDLHLRDIDGDGSDEIVVVLRRQRPLEVDEPGAPGTLEQDLLSVYRLEGPSLVRLLSQEVGLRRVGGWSFEGDISWADRRSARLRVERRAGDAPDRGDVVAFVPGTRAGASSAAYEPLPLPWQGQTRVTYQREGAAFRAVRQ